METDERSAAGRTGRASFLYRPSPPHAINTATACLDPMWVSPSGQQALLTCTRSSPAGPMSVSVLLLGSAGAIQQRQLEAVARNDLTAFGS
jgi:hypothetical protein